MGAVSVSTIANYHYYGVREEKGHNFFLLKKKENGHSEGKSCPRKAILNYGRSRTQRHVRERP